MDHLREVGDPVLGRGMGWGNSCTCIRRASDWGWDIEGSVTVGSLWKTDEG